jgi:hypothetical protein
MLACVFSQGDAMVKRMLFAMLLLTAAFPPAALSDHTDIWWNPAESGWGVNVVQNNTTQFLTFFIYGQNGQPTWYVAATAEAADGNYNGLLYATTGTYYGAPWSGALGAPAGTASFQPLDPYHATVVYALTNGPTVTKAIERQTLASQVLTGNYWGSIAGKVTGCTDPVNNKSNARGRYSLEVTQLADASATLTFTFLDGKVCTLSGPLTHLGRLYQMANAQYSCTETVFSAGAVTATIDSFHPTGQGIEGRWTASTSNGCIESIHFSAVLL